LRLGGHADHYVPHRWVWVQTHILVALSKTVSVSVCVGPLEGISSSAKKTEKT
jgi:hypothetical protein